MLKIFITRKIPEAGINKLKENDYEVVINPEDKVLSKTELINLLKNNNYDGILSLLTDKIDGEIMESAGSNLKIIANMAVGFDNIDLNEAKKREIAITNTTEVLTESVAEHTVALMFAIARRIAEADRFAREGKFKGWEPMLLLGDDLAGKKIGIVGLGRIGFRVAEILLCFGLKIIYYDIKRNEDFENKTKAVYKEKLDDLLKEADFISLHVPLLPSTRHLINAERLNLMKKSAYLINTSRGPVIDEKALVEALKNGAIRGAALDVFENEPELTPDLIDLPNVVLTPHIASATYETRSKMAELAADNIIAALEGKTPPNLVKKA